MNTLSGAKQAQIIAAICEGASIRSTARQAEVSKNTVSRAENHAYATALHFGYYNLVRAHQTLTKKAGTKTTPAMAAGVEKYPWSVHDLVASLERFEAVA